MPVHVHIIQIDPGDVVLCDLCNKDYTTDKTTTGGFLFGSIGVCPACAPHFERRIKMCHETGWIKDRAKPNEPFRDFIYRVRRR